MSTKQNDIKIKVDGKEISLNPFASSIIYSAILGMVTSLKLDSDPEIVEITLKK